jgi:hypothetical protein
MRFLTRQSVTLPAPFKWSGAYAGCYARRGLNEKYTLRNCRNQSAASAGGSGGDISKNAGCCPKRHIRMGYALEGVRRKPTSPRRRGLRLWRRVLRVELFLYAENSSSTLPGLPGRCFKKKTRRGTEYTLSGGGPKARSEQ